MDSDGAMYSKATVKCKPCIFFLITILVSCHICNCMGMKTDCFRVNDMSVSSTISYLKVTMLNFTTNNSADLPEVPEDTRKPKLDIARHALTWTMRSWSYVAYFFLQIQYLSLPPIRGTPTLTHIENVLISVNGSEIKTLLPGMWRTSFNCVKMTDRLQQVSGTLWALGKDVVWDASAGTLSASVNKYSSVGFKRAALHQEKLRLRKQDCVCNTKYEITLSRSHIIGQRQVNVTRSVTNYLLHLTVSIITENTTAKEYQLTMDEKQELVTINVSDLEAGIYKVLIEPHCDAHLYYVDCGKDKADSTISANSFRVQPLKETAFTLMPQKQPDRTLYQSKPKTAQLIIVVCGFIVFATATILCITFKTVIYKFFSRLFAVQKKTKVFSKNTAIVFYPDSEQHKLRVDLLKTGLEKREINVQKFGDFQSPGMLENWIATGEKIARDYAVVIFVASPKLLEQCSDLQTGKLEEINVRDINETTHAVLKVNKRHREESETGRDDKTRKCRKGTRKLKEGKGRKLRCETQGDDMKIHHVQEKRVHFEEDIEHREENTNDNEDRHIDEEEPLILPHRLPYVILDSTKAINATGHVDKKRLILLVRLLGEGERNPSLDEVTNVQLDNPSVVYQKAFDVTFVGDTLKDDAMLSELVRKLKY